MLKIRKFNHLEFLKGPSGLFSLLFWISVILTLTIYVCSTIVLFLNPYQLTNFNENEHLFLGFYNLNVAEKDLYLNWIAYIFGVANIALVIINSLIYWLFMRISISNFINRRYLMVSLLISVIMSILFFILNIFNRPLFDINQLNILENGWCLDISQLNSSLTFNYVFTLNFVTDGTKVLSTNIQLNNFSIIWILSIVVAGVSYVTTLLLLLYNKRCSLSIVTYKEDE